MDIQKLHKAKERFDAAKKQHGDSASAANWTADGLSHLADALMDIERELTEIRKLLMERQEPG